MTAVSELDPGRRDRREPGQHALLGQAVVAVGRVGHHPVDRQGEDRVARHPTDLPEDLGLVAAQVLEHLQSDEEVVGLVGDRPGTSRRVVDDRPAFRHAVRLLAEVEDVRPDDQRPEVGPELEGRRQAALADQPLGDPARRRHVDEPRPVVRDPQPEVDQLERAEGPDRAGPAAEPVRGPRDEEPEPIRECPDGSGIRTVVEPPDLVPDRPEDRTERPEESPQPGHGPGHRVRCRRPRPGRPRVTWPRRRRRARHPRRSR